MQAECELMNGMCHSFENKPECKFKKVCNGCQPRKWDLTDPPRFDERQMEFWKWWSEQGADYVYGEVYPARHLERERKYLVFVQREPYQEIGRVEGKMHEWLETCETLDLAELFGKEGA